MRRLLTGLAIECNLLLVLGGHDADSAPPLTIPSSECSERVCRLRTCLAFKRCYFLSRLLRCEAIKRDSCMCGLLMCRFFVVPLFYVLDF